MPTYQLNAPAVALIGRESDSESVTVIGPFGSVGECGNWAAARGLDMLTRGVHTMSGHQVMPPDYAERMLTSRYIGGYHPADDGTGYFRGGSGLVDRLGESRDGVPTVAVMRVPDPDALGPHGPGKLVAMGIFASSQDATTWMHRIDSFYPRVKISERATLRSVLTPDQFFDKLEEFRLKGQIA